MDPPKGNEPINTQSGHSKEETTSVPDNKNTHVHDSSSGDVSTSPQEKLVLHKRSGEGADLLLDNSSPSRTSGAGGSSVAVEHQQQAHNESSSSAHDGKQSKEQKNMFSNKQAVDMRPGVSYIKFSFMRNM